MYSNIRSGLASAEAAAFVCAKLEGENNCPEKNKHMNEGFCCKQRGHKNQKYISPSQGSGGSFALLAVHVIVSMSATIANYVTAEAKAR